jgi:hypothetical protein
MNLNQSNGTFSPFNHNNNQMTSDSPSWQVSPMNTHKRMQSANSSKINSYVRQETFSDQHSIKGDAQMFDENIFGCGK